MELISELAARVFTARDIAHMRHWKTKSYAEHVALGAFYDESIDAIDAVIEAYQGLVADIDPFKVTAERVDDIKSYLQDELDWVEANRDEITHGSPTIGNLVDTLSGVYAKTIFLLGLK